MRKSNIPLSPDVGISIHKTFDTQFSTPEVVIPDPKPIFDFLSLKARKVHPGKMVRPVFGKACDKAKKRQTIVRAFGKKFKSIGEIKTIKYLTPEVLLWRAKTRSVRVRIKLVNYRTIFNFFKGS